MAAQLGVYGQARPVWLSRINAKCTRILGLRPNGQLDLNAASLGVTIVGAPHWTWGELIYVCAQKCKSIFRVRVGRVAPRVLDRGCAAAAVVQGALQEPSELVAATSPDEFNDKHRPVQKNDSISLLKFQLHD
mmetsp:Transcript_22615/g.70789  ORF Transcript_22615/g.70789 Transcript_22615/m.70789 type:complete len:133 (-) Transcript_22615:938-1336(-)